MDGHRCVFLPESKGQLVSKANCQAVNSSKKQSNEFVFTTMGREFVRFLEEFTAWQFAFEIIWPLDSGRNTHRCPSTTWLVILYKVEFWSTRGSNGSETRHDDVGPLTALSLLTEVSNFLLAFLLQPCYFQHAAATSTASSRRRARGARGLA